MELIRRVALASLASIALVACGRDSGAHPDSAAKTVADAAAPATPAAPGSCPRTGHWTECTIRIRLEQSGLAPRVTTEKIGDLPKLPVPPLTSMVGNAGFAAYLFSDTLARHAAAATIDSVAFLPQSKPVGMRGEGTIIQNDNLLVLLFSRNEHQRERVADAITAGPPQP